MLPLDELIVRSVPAESRRVPDVKVIGSLVEVNVVSAPLFILKLVLAL